MQIAMIQDRILSLEDLDQAYFDRALYFGDGVYEGIRSYNGKIFALEEHLRRFSKSLAAIGIDGVDIEQIRARVTKAFETADIANAKIYFHISRGSELRNHVPGPALEPNFLLTITRIEEKKEIKTKGIAVSTHPDLRWKRCDIKSLNLLPNILARQEAAKKGCDEAILVNEAGLITEGAGSAFFAIFGKNLQTSPLSANILPSVTRGFVIQAAKKTGLQIVEESVPVKQAICADELFTAVTTKGIVPVVSFDDKLIGKGIPGKYTASLIETFHSFTG